MRTLIPGLTLLAVSLAAQPAPPAGLKRLESNIERITRSANARWGIYLKCLETGEEISLNAAQPMDTMSVIKIPLMVEAFRQIEEGRYALTDRVSLKESDKRPGTGIIRSLDAGASFTVKDLLTLMNIVSDNTATDLLFDKVGGVEPVNRLMQTWGLASIRATGPTSVWFAALRAAPSPQQFHQEGKTPFGMSSPQDMGRLLERIATGQAVSRKASEQMLEMMRGQVYNTRLPKYVTGFRVPHKTGDFLPYIGNDVGVLESPARRVVICVFTAEHLGVGPYLEDSIARIGELVANYFAR
ncbi:MAG: serine hydrolase [Acidobacteria bacterium]|nr:serine hydrolase [Acidobacteriota bacterium]